jgi:carbamoyl-phosphate synthase small subunit
VNNKPTFKNGLHTGRLALADGSVFRGEAFGAVSTPVLVTAEVVFNTAMCGYQESLTDPSYTGQILVQTAPLIGNTGTNSVDVESTKVHVSGFVVHELARRWSNYRGEISLDEYLQRAGVMGLAGIDTRALVRVLRSGGAMSGVLTNRNDVSDRELVDTARSAARMDGQNLVAGVGCDRACGWSGGRGEWAVMRDSRPRLRVLALDCGIKQNILRLLTEHGCDVTLVPHTISADEIVRVFESGEADGLFISNGPGDPAAVTQTVEMLRGVLGAWPRVVVPTFGICLGLQLLALACGAKTYKLPFGHRGANQPVRSALSGRVEITSQNHGFAVDADSLRACGGEVTHVHLNDATVAGFRLVDRPVFAVQYHPEASPGPHDADGLFAEFVKVMQSKRSPMVTASA